MVQRAMLRRRICRAPRGVLASALAVALSAGLAGCTDDEAEPVSGAATSPSADASTTGPAEPSPGESSSETPETKPSASPTTRPLSRFEDKAPVKATRAFAVGIGRAVNKGDGQLRGMSRLLTANGLAVLPDGAAEDAGLYYPGPLPFTPLRVKTDGRRSTVVACVMGDGWAQDRASKLPARALNIIPIEFRLVKVDGRWKIDDAVPTGQDCRSVNVKGVPW